VAALFAAGNSLVVGTVSPDGEPRATRAWAVTVSDADAGRVRVVMTGDDPVTIANLAGGRIAVTGCAVRTLRAAQLKGQVVSIDPPTADDMVTFEEHSDEFFQEVHETDGNPIELLRRLLPRDVVVVDVAVDEVFDQSPGPGAGASVPAGRRP
jgi:hypothetical protein